MHFAQLRRKHTATQTIMQDAYSAFMENDDALAPLERPSRLTRRLRLIDLIKEAGGPTQLALIVEIPKSHISAMQSGSRNVGDDLATKIESKMGKPFGWMDQIHGVDPRDLTKTSDDIPLEPPRLANLLNDLDDLTKDMAIAALRYWLDNPTDSDRAASVMQKINSLVAASKGLPKNQAKKQAEANSDSMRTIYTTHSKQDAA